MRSADVHDYVEKYKAKGRSEARIRADLISRGAQVEDVDTFLPLKINKNHKYLVSSILAIIAIILVVGVLRSGITGLAAFNIMPVAEDAGGVAEVSIPVVEESLRIATDQRFEIMADESSVNWTMFRHNLNHTSYTTASAPSNISNMFASFPTGGDVDSSPAVSGGFVYIQGGDGKMYQLNASNISQKISEISAGVVSESSPAVSGGFVYAGFDGDQLYQLNASNISLKIANFSTGGTVHSSPAVAGGFVYVGSGLPGGDQLYQLNASNVSQKIANFSAGTIVYSSPAVSGGFVYIGSLDKQVYQLNASNVSLLIANFSTGAEVHSSPAVSGGYVYIGSQDDQLYQLNASNISQKIANFSAGGNVASSPAVWGGFVYVGSNANQVYQLNASNISQKIANFSTSNIVHSSPTVAGGFVYIGSWDKQVYQLNASNISQKIANFSTGAFVDFSSPTIYEGFLYIGSQDSNLYQLGEGVAAGGSGSCSCLNCSDCESDLNNATCATVTLSQDILVNGTCINDPINFSNKTLDCKGYAIIGNETGTGINIGKNNNTITNCSIINFSTNLQISGSLTVIENVTTQESLILDIWITSSACNTIINNVNGSAGRPILFYNTSVNLANTSNISELILCNADYSNLTNITVMGSDTKQNNGIIIHLTDYSNFTRINSSNNYYGLVSDTSNNNMITNSVFNYNNKSGILLDDDNITLINNTANSNLYGIELGSSSGNCTLLNNTVAYNTRGIEIDESLGGNLLVYNNASYNDYGFWIETTYFNTLQNNTAQENDYYDIYVIAVFANQCNNVIENTTGSGNRDIRYYNSSINLGNQTFSELILCNADYSNITNVTISGSESLDNNGLYIGLTNYSNISNINSSDNYVGVYLLFSNNNTVMNNNLNSNLVGFFGVGSASPLTLTGNTIVNNNITLNSAVGITFQGANSNNSIYNNYLNNTLNARDTASTNYWNTTYACGGQTNILGGNCMGGNFWHDYSGADDGSGGRVAADGIGDTDLPYNVSGNITNGGDYLPLMQVAGGLANCQCDSCISCQNNLSDAACTQVNLTQSINAAGTCITWPTGNKTFDCKGYEINGSGISYGIYLSGDNNNTIRNCNITNFLVGIHLDSSSNQNTLINNTIYNNSWYGIQFDKVYNNTIINNTLLWMSSAGGHGVFLSGSYNNSIINNTANSNEKCGIFLSNSSNNTITNNTLQENSYSDLFIGFHYSADIDCSNIIESNIGSGNRPIRYYNSSVNLANETISELILCNADNSNITNVTITGSSSVQNNGVFVHLTDNANLTSVNASDTAYGFYFTNSSYNIIDSCIANNISTEGGFELLSSSYNNLTNNIAKYNGDDSSDAGILIYGGSFNSLINNTALGNPYFGILILTGSNNSIISNDISSNSSANGLIIQDSVNVSVINNTILGGIFSLGLSMSSKEGYFSGNNISSSSYGIYLISSYNNTFVNNYVENSSQIDFADTLSGSGNNIQNLILNGTNISAIGVNYSLDFAVSPANDPNNYRNLSYYLNVSNLSAVGSWINLSFNYKDSDIVGFPESSIRIWNASGASWSQTEQPYGQSEASNYVWANISTFSIFAPMGNLSAGADSNPPNVTILAPINSAIVRSSILINATVIDNSGVNSAAVYYWLSNSLGNQTSWTNMTNNTATHFNATFNTSLLSDGYYNLTINASDNDGNQNASEMITIYIDNTAPKVSLTTPASGYVSTTAYLTLGYSATDNLDIASCSFILNDNLEQTETTIWNNTELTFMRTGLTNDAYTWYVNCTDIAGNQNSSETRTFTISSSATTRQRRGFIEEPEARTVVPEPAKAIPPEETVFLGEDQPPSEREAEFSILAIIGIIGAIIALILFLLFRLLKKRKSSSKLDKLANYIQENMAKGYSFEIIKSALVKSGWTEQQISDAIQKLKATPPMK